MTNNDNQKVNHVGGCCCFDLHTGGLIFGYIELILTLWQTIGLLKHPSSGYYDWMWNFLAIVIFGFWVYGVHEGRTDLMLPNLIWSTVVFIACAVIFIIITMTALGWNDHAIEIIAEKYPEIKKEYASMGHVPVLIIFILSAIFFAISWFWVYIKYSLYAQMKMDARRGNDFVMSTGTEHTTVRVGFDV